MISEIRKGCFWRVCELQPCMLPGCLDSGHLGNVGILPQENCTYITSMSLATGTWCRIGTTSKDRAKPVGCSESGGKQQEVRDRAGRVQFPSPSREICGLNLLWISKVFIAFLPCLVMEL